MALSDKHICFLADRHGLYDDRIYWKMAVPLVQLGCKVSYILIGPEEKSGTTKEGIAFHMLKLKTYSGNRYLNYLLKRSNPSNNYKKMFDLARALQADIYHIHDLWVNRIGIRLKELPYKPIVFYDAREPYAEDLRSLYKSNFKWITDLFADWVDRWEKNKARHYDLVIANEELVRDAFREELGESRAEVLFNYPDMHQGYRALSEDEKEYDLIYCGGITCSRGAMRMLRVVERLKNKIPEVRLLLLGRIDPEELENRMRRFILDKSLGKNVVLHKPVGYEQVGEFYNKSRVGLLLWEHIDALKIKLPIKLFEYMCFGLPILGSDFGHIGAYIKKDSCGIAVDQENEEEAAEKLFRLLKNKALYDKFSENALKKSHQKYRWETEFNRLTEFYKKALHESA